jgi:GNAT superfamily N-acetyltransferase
VGRKIDRVSVVRDRAAEQVEEHTTHMFRMTGGLTGMELHDDDDIVWKTGPGRAWGNSGIRLRFDASTVAARLDEVVGRYRALRRPAGFWVSAFATPADIATHLKRLGFTCRKHFPAMNNDLRALKAKTKASIAGLRFDRLPNFERFRQAEHPYLGRISTAQRRLALAAQDEVYRRWPDRLMPIVATLDDTTVGFCLLCLDGETAGLHDVGVLASFRNRGIGAALCAHACGVARDAGYRDCVLIATGMGHGVYARIGFREVGKISYWYSKLDRTYDY